MSTNDHPRAGRRLDIASLAHWAETLQHQGHTVTNADLAAERARRRHNIASEWYPETKSSPILRSMYVRDARARETLRKTLYDDAIDALAANDLLNGTCTLLLCAYPELPPNGVVNEARTMQRNVMVYATNCLRWDQGKRDAIDALKETFVTSLAVPFTDAWIEAHVSDYHLPSERLNNRSPQKASGPQLPAQSSQPSRPVSPSPPSRKQLGTAPRLAIKGSPAKPQQDGAGPSAPGLPPVPLPALPSSSILKSPGSAIRGAANPRSVAFDIRPLSPTLSTLLDVSSVTNEGTSSSIEVIEVLTHAQQDNIVAKRIALFLATETGREYGEFFVGISDILENVACSRWEQEVGPRLRIGPLLSAEVDRMLKK